MNPLARQLLSQEPLDQRAELRLARRARAGDLVARDALLSASLRLVVLRATSLGKSGDDLDEAVQAGTLGLIAAVDRFDPDRGCRLATYAWPWITSAILELGRREVPLSLLVDLAQADEPPPPSVDVEPAMSHLPRRLAAVVRLRYRLGEQSGPPRTRAEVGERLGLTPRQVRADEAQAMAHLRRRLARVGDRAPRVGADPL